MGEEGEDGEARKGDVVRGGHGPGLPTPLRRRGRAEPPGRSLPAGGCAPRWAAPARSRMVGSGTGNRAPAPVRRWLSGAFGEGRAQDREKKPFTVGIRSPTSAPSIPPAAHLPRRASPCLNTAPLRPGLSLRCTHVQVPKGSCSLRRAARGPCGTGAGGALAGVGVTAAEMMGQLRFPLLQVPISVV